MRLLSVHELGVERGRGLPALQPVFTRDKQRYIARFRCERLSVAKNCGQSVVSVADRDHDLAGQTISPQGGMIV
jgi:hypothetical protein